jgi:hypothetical protein
MLGLTVGLYLLHFTASQHLRQTFPSSYLNLVLNIKSLLILKQLAAALYTKTFRQNNKK